MSREKYFIKSFIVQEWHEIARCRSFWVVRATWYRSPKLPILLALQAFCNCVSLAYVLLIYINSCFCGGKNHGVGYDQAVINVRDGGVIIPESVHEMLCVSSAWIEIVPVYVQKSLF